ncbi:MAG: hypothetical protein K5912_00590 [Alphaproteobacteria bacterium]|nr:hypothetical protein [Alphaproteobacteria bacterium]
MKKTLLSAIAGLAVIGSAAAIPTPDTARENCMKLGGTHVWVEKNKECVPINPCTEPKDSEYHKNYCLHYIIQVSDEEKARLWVKRYTQNVLKASPVNIQIEQTNNLPANYFYLRVKTSDDGYFETEVQYAENHIKMDTSCSSSLFAATIAYLNPDHNKQSLWNYKYTDPDGKRTYYLNTPSKKICQDIIDFSDTLANTNQNIKIKEYSSRDNQCVIECSGTY